MNVETELDKQLAPEEAQIDQFSLKEILVSRTIEILISHTRETRNCNNIIIDNIFVFQVAMDIMKNVEDQEP